MKFKVHSLLMAALAVTALAPLARAVDSVNLIPSLVSATAVGGGALPTTPPAVLQGSTLYIYGSAQAAVYTVNFNVLANLAAGEGFSGISAAFNPSAGVTIPATPYTPNGAAVWSFILPGAVNETINNTYGSGDLVASIGPYTSAGDPTRAAFAQTVSAPVGQLKVQWNGTTNNATLKLSDTTSSTPNQIQFQTDNLSTGVISNGVTSAGQFDIQFVTPLNGDANLDGSVDVSDLGILSTFFGQTVTGGRSKGDFSGDGSVDVSDLGILSTFFGSTWTTGLSPAVAFGGVAAAPEPTSLAVLGLGSLILLKRKTKSA